MDIQFLKCRIMITLFLIGLIAATDAQNLVQTLSSKIMPSDNTQDQNNVIMDGNRKSFAGVLKEMDKALDIKYTPCSLYDPPRPFLQVEGRRVSEIKCLQHIWDVKVKEETKKKMDLCQTIFGKQLFGIVGGRNSKPGEFPHMGAVGWKTEEEGKYAFKCGSFLISNRFVLTAAHCQYDEELKHPKIVRFGVTNISNGKTNPDQPPEDIKILKFIKHELYKPNFKEFDIAVIELANRVTFNDYIQPACILNQNVHQAIISGWGYTDESDAKISEELQVAEVDVLPHKTCSRKWKAKRDRTHWPRFFKSQMCAVKMTGRVADICAGDSGGPLQSALRVNTKRTIYNVVGITSLNSNCGSLNFPSVFTRVSSYVDWIEEKVWGVKSEPKKVDNVDKQASKPSPSVNEIDTTDDNEKSRHTSVKDRIVKINDVQNFDNGALFWFDSTKGSQWVYLDKSEIEKNKLEAERMKNSLLE